MKRSTSKIVLLILATLITLIAGWLHAGGRHDMIAWDEADYMLAADAGFAANAWQMGELNAELRHWHAPGTAYAIAASTAVFGDDEWAARLPAVLAAALTCGLMVLAGFDLSRGLPMRTRIAAGTIAGLAMATAPASIEMTGVIQPHSFVALLLLLNVWTLSRWLRDGRRRDAVLFGLTVGGQFVVMEYGPVVLFWSIVATLFAKPALLGLQWRRPWVIRRATNASWSEAAEPLIRAGDCVSDEPALTVQSFIARSKVRSETQSPARTGGWHGRADSFPLAHEGAQGDPVAVSQPSAQGDPPWANRKSRADCPCHPRRRLLNYLPAIHRDVFLAAGVCLLTILLLWPAGVLRGGAVLNFVYYLVYAANGHPILFRGELTEHVPKYAYAWWYFRDYPLLLLAMLAAVAAMIAWAWRMRSATAICVAVFALGLVATVHASHIMSLKKSLFMVPALCLGGALAGAWWWSRFTQGASGAMGKRVRELTRACLRFGLPACAVAAILGGQLRPMVKAGQENERLIAMCRAIADRAEPGDQVLAQGWPIVRYLLTVKFGRDDLTVHAYDPRNVDASQPPAAQLGEFDWVVTIGATTAAHPDCAWLRALHHEWRVVMDQDVGEREYRVYGSASPTVHTSASSMFNVESSGRSSSVSQR